MQDELDLRAAGRGHGQVHDPSHLGSRQVLTRRGRHDLDLVARGQRVNCRDIVGDNSPNRRSSRHSSDSRSKSASQQQTQLLCRWSNSAT